MARMAIETGTKKAPNAVRAAIKLRFASQRVRGVLRIVIVLLVAGVIFAAGVGVGSGRIYPGMFAKTESGLPAHLNYASVNKVYQLIRSQYDGKLTTTQLLDGLKNGLTNSLNDPYSEYFTPAQANDFNNQLAGSFSGIGAELGKNTSGQLTIIAPVADSPAAKAGLQTGDIIAAINGKSTAGISIDAAVSSIRGVSGTKVTLGVVRGTQGLTLTITRANIVVPSVTSSVLAGTHGPIGYIQIAQFSDDTGSLAQAAAQKLVDQKVQGIILDLRDNPGGLVDAAVDVTSLWLPNGATILQEKRGDTVVQTYKATGGNILQNVPTVVLVDGGSASAAEITAGALHDNKVATILGEKTYGKGVVQQLNTLAGGAELKVTIASWYRPNGQSINHTGITPDKIVQSAAGDAPGGNDAQKAAALQLLESK